jgi:hypothetical protein
VDEKHAKEKDTGKQYFWKEGCRKSKGTLSYVIEIDSREIFRVRNWKRESLDRQVWKRHLNEAKARLEDEEEEEEEEE